MFGTDFPILRFDRTVQEIEALNIRPGPLNKLMRDNANRLYKLGLD
jgi:predicted TIM-barrel fold metal-dependent hydrolase